MKEFINDNFFQLTILASIITICIFMLIVINKVEKNCKKDNNSFMCKPIQEVYK